MSVEVQLPSGNRDVFTGRPRTPNDPYTHLTNQQIHNIQKELSPHFHTIKADKPLSALITKPGGRQYVDRYCKVTSQHVTRGISGSQPFGWIDYQWQRLPPDAYNTCRGRASVRWGPNKAGERTRSHFMGESIDRYTTIDMYRRNPTNEPGRVVMDCGRPADGYYNQKYPSKTTWFGSSVPLNRGPIVDSGYRKTAAQYADIQQAQQMARTTRQGQWPEFSEYTSKFLLQHKTAPRINNLQEKKRHLTTA